MMAFKSNSMAVEAVVEFEYQAEQEDELSLKVGDVITNVITAEGGWWEGELNGKKGMFPENFVKLVKRREPTSVKKEEKREAAQRKSVRELANKFKDGVPIGGIPKKKEKKKKCKVLFEYKRENDDELDLQVGEIIEFHKQVEEGWWEGSLNGKHGVFPSNFVELIEEQSSSDESGQTNSEDKEKNSDGKDDNFQAIKGKKIVGVGLGNIFGGGPIKLRPTADSGKKEEGSKSGKQGEPELTPEVAKREKPNTIEKAVVRFSYNAEQPDELSLVEGQILRILDKELEDEGWWKGELNGKVGVFPDNFVELLANEETSKPKKPPLPTSSAAKQVLPVKVSEKSMLDSSDDRIKSDNFSFSNARKGKKLNVSHSSRHSPGLTKRAHISKELSSIIEAVEQMKDEDSMVLFRPDARSKLHYYYESTAPSITKKPVAPPPIGKKPSNQKSVEQKIEPVATQKVVLPPKEKSSSRENHSDERITDDSRSFEGIEPAGQKLTHLTANRAKGPKKRPPSTVLTLNDGEKESDLVDECKNNFSGSDKPLPQTDKHSHLPDRPEKPTVILPPKDNKYQSQPPSEPEPPSLPTLTTHRDQNVPPPRPPEPNTNKAPLPATPTSGTAVNKLIEQLQKEVQELRANSVSKLAFNELKAEHEKLKLEFESMRNMHSKKFRELENEVDEEKKLRLTTQVEIERVKKFMSETNV